MKTYIAKSDAEAADLHAGTQTEIEIPVPLPDGPWNNVLGPYQGGVYLFTRPSLDWHEAHRVTCPYVVGDVIAVREDKPMSLQGPAFYLLVLTIDCWEKDGKWAWIVTVKKEMNS